MAEISVFENASALFAEAAEFIIKVSRESIKTSGRFTIALSGGSTPNGLYTLLATAPYAQRIDFSKWFVCWGDERMLPANDEDNNSHQAITKFLDHVDIPNDQVFPVPVNLEPLEAANVYEQTLHRIFKHQPVSFDLILLGMGDNGHTASLFPHRPILNDQEPHIRADNIPEVKMWRITFNAPMINHAHHVLFLVSGKAKRSMLHTILDGPKNPEVYPAQLIDPPHGRVYWYVDKEALDRMD